MENWMSGSEDSASQRLAEMPLFPLDVVLFPNMILPLHIFEERYKEMIHRCWMESIPFGIVLVKGIKEGSGRVETFPVGCTARIARLDRLADGRMNIEVIGERRFKILDTHEQLPYRVGLTESYQDYPTDEDELLVRLEEAQRLLREFLVRSLEMMGQEVGEFELPADAEQLSFTAACVLPISNPEKQDLLSEQDALSRLHTIHSLLEREIIRLRRMVEAGAQVVWKPVDSGQYEDYRSTN
jgi:uncharacterized protein